MQERDIFIEALQKQGPADRGAYLHAACAGDTELRSRVERLLLEHERQQSFILDSPAAGLGPDLEPPLSLTAPGTVIGRYKILEPIGEGGYGVVFMAEQTTPVQRKVALKIIKAGMDTRQVIARFEAERQALALMDHPNIAKVFDAGETDSGRPYFVMELVKGMPITRYCDEHRVEPRQRLELFMQVCQAVQHAHQKGIIHRDIKPNNVLVAQYDGKPVPKVIDFGVAKATGQSLTDLTMFTGLGDVIGTLEYMSPEQAEVNQLDVDTRSDIYSLGVLLYELLTGSTPLEHKRVMKAGLLEMLRLVREEEPQRPSTRLMTSEQLPSISANRGLEPKTLSGLVLGELDWIVMKALEKDRARRYETANGFAMDVQHYLHDEAVQACPPSARYRFRKFARRNRAALVTATLALVAVLLVAGTAGWAVRDRASRRATVAARAEQVMAESETLYRQRKLPEAAQVARSALALVDGGAGGAAVERRAREWLKDLEMVTRVEEINPRNDVHPARKLGEYPQAFREYGIDIDALSPEEAAARIRASSISLDLVVALDRWVYYALTYGFHLGTDGEKQVAQQAARLRQIARLTDPDPMRNRLRDSFVRVPPPGITDPDPMRNRLREDGKVDAAEMRRIAASVDVATTPMATLMLIGDAQPKWSEMVAFFTRVQRQRPSDFGVTFYLGRLLKISGDSDNAIRYLTAALSIRPQSGHTRLELGRVLIHKGLVDEGIAQLEEASRLAPHTISKSRYQLEIGEILLGRPGSEEAAAAALREAIRLVPDSAETHVAVGDAFRGIARHDDALAAYSRAIELNPGVWKTWYARARVYAQQHKAEKASSDLARVMELAIDAVAQNEIAWSLATDPDPSWRNPTLAVAFAERAIAARPTDGIIWNTLGVARYRAGDWRGAIDALKKSEQLIPDQFTSFNAFFLAMAHWQLGEQDQARQWHGQAVEWMKKEKWKDDAELRRIRTEAEELLKITDPKPTTKPESK